MNLENNKIKTTKSSYTLFEEIEVNNIEHVYSLENQPLYNCVIYDIDNLDTTNKKELKKHLLFLHNLSNKEALQQVVKLPIDIIDMDNIFGFIYKKRDNLISIDKYLGEPNEIKLKDRIKVSLAIYRSLNILQNNNLIISNVKPDIIKINPLNTSLVYFDTSYLRTSYNNIINYDFDLTYLPKCYETKYDDFLMNLFKLRCIDTNYLPKYRRITLSMNLYSFSIITFKLLTDCFPINKENINENNKSGYILNNIKEDEIDDNSSLKNILNENIFSNNLLKLYSTVFNKLNVNYNNKMLIDNFIMELSNSLVKDNNLDTEDSIYFAIYDSISLKYSNNEEDSLDLIKEQVNNYLFNHLDDPIYEGTIEMGMQAKIYRYNLGYSTNKKSLALILKYVSKDEVTIKVTDEFILNTICLVSKEDNKTLYLKNENITSFNFNQFDIYYCDYDVLGNNVVKIIKINKNIKREEKVNNEEK